MNGKRETESMAGGGEVLLLQPASVREDVSACFQELWLATRRKPWRTLALVPAQESLSVYRLALRLARAGELAERAPIDVLRADCFGPQGLAQLADELRQGPPRGLSILSLGGLQARPFGARLAQAADAVVIVLSLGETHLSDARRAASLIGRDKLLGCVALRG